MPSISKIRLTNVIYEEGLKRYNDELFTFDGENGAIILENGGGKTVMIHTALQAIIPHTDLAERKIKNTLLLDNAPAHIAIEWIHNDQPRRYVVTAVTLFLTKDGLDSLRYVYEYGENDENGITGIPFVRAGKEGKRPAERGEMQDYYSHMHDRTFLAQTFSTIKEYRSFLEEQYHIITEEWDSIVQINSSEGGVEKFFDECKSANQLFDRLLIPVVENSIAGHHPQIFADMFEKQHASLKQYKKLRETIEENQRIQGALEKYVDTFALFHESQQSYQQVKQRAKGLWEEVQFQKDASMKEKATCLQELETWEKAAEYYKIKLRSYEVAIEKSRYEEFQKVYEEANAMYTSKKEEWEKNNKAYYSLKLAKLKDEQKHEREKIEVLEAEIEKLDQTEDLQELELQLDEARSSLLGYFLGKMETIQKDIDSVQYELRPLQEQINRYHEQIKHIDAEEQQYQQTLARLENQGDLRRKDMEKLVQLLLAHPKQQRVQDELVQWQERHQLLDEEIIRLQQGEKQSTIDQTTAMRLKEELVQARTHEQGVLERLEQGIQVMEEEQSELIAKLTSLRPQWAFLTTIYEREHTVMDRLKATIAKLKDQKEQRLYHERIAYRFVDDYGKQATFFSDPFLHSQVQAWKDQMDQCITGVEYMQMLDEEKDKGKLAYPLWPITLITTNKSKALLQDKVAHVADRLQFPIQVLTNEEAASVDQHTGEFTWIAPLHWEEGMDNETFIQWKTSIHLIAQEAKEARENIENEIYQWEQGFTLIQQFFSKYPFEKISAIKEEVVKRRIKIESLHQQLEKENEKIAALQVTIEQLRSEVSKKKEERDGLAWKIEKGNEYLRYQQELNEAERKAQQIKEDLAKKQTKLYQLKREQISLQEEAKRHEDRKTELQVQLSLLKKDEDYSAVKHLTPRYTGEGKSIIQYQIRTIENKIQNIHGSYHELKVSLDHAQSSLKRIAHEMEELRREQGELDEERIFPSDGERLIATLWLKNEQDAKEVEKLRQQVAENVSAKEKQYGKWQSLLEQFNKKYPNVAIVEFTVSLAEVKEGLREEERRIAEKKQYLDQEERRIEQALHSIEVAERLLERYIEKHHFNAPQLSSVPLSPDERLEFTYQRRWFTQGIISELEKARGQVESEQEHVDEQKQAFRKFCLSISNVKMRKMAEQGIEYKQTYAELFEFKKNMLISVERATHYANEHIRQKDAELQAFINQIHAHLVTVVEELNQIPKKTKIKVDDVWKTIYTFTIPAWDEEEGKNRIRDHLEWILKQLESESYLKEDGTPDDTKIRKSMEMWLQSKQLLQVVMKHEGMKVSCRKVTNEKKVSSRSYSWKESNNWSGGEKWSKNMTLFLGILNYVAEKKQHLEPNMKRNRTVILDNPFGKASSEHVLSPVFFVADQLGFQVIALTAHAEGKFLQDYFPVVYSCRLRESADASKQVITKEKWLYSAYFKEGSVPHYANTLN